MPPQASGNSSDYPLPASDIPPEVRSQLDPWVAGFIGLSGEQANERVRERWSEIEWPSLMALRDTLLKFEVQGISKTHSGFAIKAHRPGSDDPGIGDYWYLAGPMDRGEITRRLTPFGLEENEALRDFLFFFGGLAEDTKMSGHFVSGAEDWWVFDDSEGWGVDPQATDGYYDWEGSLRLFFARDGCQILVDRDGAAGWWIPEGTVTTETTSFDGFIRMFNKHRRSSRPFDPYPPDEDEE